MAEKTTDVFVGGYRDIDAATKEFDGSQRWSKKRSGRSRLRS